MKSLLFLLLAPIRTAGPPRLPGWSHWRPLSVPSTTAYTY